MLGFFVKSASHYIKMSDGVQVASVRCRLTSKLALASRRTPSMPRPIYDPLVNRVTGLQQISQTSKRFRYKLYITFHKCQGFVNPIGYDF